VENNSVTRLKQLGSMFHGFGLVVVLAMCSLALSSHAFATDTARGGDVVVTAVKGDVSVTMRGQPRRVKAGTVMELAASVRTGANSSLQLRQGNTTFSVAAESFLDLPAGAAAGDPIDRVMQTRGNVLYDVGKRGVRKLRVETPYLVAVVKGTQFNVAVQDDSSVISLFEGLLEIQASDGSDIVDLKAGEIAIRGRADRTIRVIRMDTGEPVARAETRHAPVGTGSNDSGSGTTRPASPVETELARVAPTTNDARTPQANGTVGVSTSTGTLNVSAQSSTSADLGLQAGDKTLLGVAGPTVDVGLGVGVDAGALNVAVDAGVDVGGATSVDLGANLGVDPGAGTVDLGVSAGVDVGGASVDLGVGAGVDLGGGTVDVSLDAGVDLGGTAVDAGVDAGVDLGAGTVDLGLDAGVAGVDAGIDAGVDLSAGTVGADVNVGDLDLGLDVDLGSGTIDLGVGTVTPTAPPSSGSSPPSSGGGLLGGVGGIVGGLLGGGN
jgi:hypothetical protein